MIKKLNDLNVAIIGLGYVGLPLAIEFAKKRKVVGFDINKKRVEQLDRGIDKTLEISSRILKSSKKNIKFTDDIHDIKNQNCYIITVPTPIFKSKKPNLNFLRDASRLVGEIIKKDDIVIYESTVYPGCTEEFCIPIIEKYSQLKLNSQFYCGYSPERINPSDKKHNISNIKKVVSGSNSKVTNLINKLYKQIVIVGTHVAPSIKIAEAAKVIENTQRDINIALMNEFAILFNKLNISSKEVLKAAQTKWNFLPFKPGLVGGHCIGVDPYYLTYKAKEIGYRPEVILAGRKINDKMGVYVANELLRSMKSKKIKIKNANILILGAAFKENCTDLRNSGVKSVINKLKKSKCNVHIYDPVINDLDFFQEFHISPIKYPKKRFYESILIAVPHKLFLRLGIDEIAKFGKKNSVIFDLKSLFISSKVDLSL